MEKCLRRSSRSRRGWRSPYPQPLHAVRVLHGSRQRSRLPVRVRTQTGRLFLAGLGVSLSSTRPCSRSPSSRLRPASRTARRWRTPAAGRSVHQTQRPSVLSRSLFATKPGRMWGLRFEKFSLPITGRISSAQPVSTSCNRRNTSSGRSTRTTRSFPKVAGNTSKQPQKVSAIRRLMTRTSIHSRCPCHPSRS